MKHSQDERTGEKRHRVHCGFFGRCYLVLQHEWLVPEYWHDDWRTRGLFSFEWRDALPEDELYDSMLRAREETSGE